MCRKEENVETFEVKKEMMSNMINDSESEKCNETCLDCRKGIKIGQNIP